MRNEHFATGARLSGFPSPYITKPNFRVPRILSVDVEPALKFYEDTMKKKTFLDQFMTYDKATVDGAGAFLVGELEKLDPTLHMPLVSYTWSRDVDLREDVTVADEQSSYTNSSFAAAGGSTTTGKNWIGKDVNAIQGIALDIGKTVSPLYLWATELSYTIPELVSAQKLGRSIDQQKYEAMQIKWNMDVDEQVYTGDTLLAVTGLVNSNPANGGIIPVAAVTGATWATKIGAGTMQPVLDDVNEALTTCWANSAWTLVPDHMLIPPIQYSLLVKTVMTIATSGIGTTSLLKFLLDNNMANQNGKHLDIQPLKHLIGMGVGGTPRQTGTVDRMVVYTKAKNVCRYPLTALQRTPLEFRSLFQMTTYWGRLGVMEFPYGAEAVLYRDGI